MKTNTILIVNNHPKKTTSLPFLKKTAAQLLEQIGLTDCTVEITLTDDRFMRVQNKKHMGYATTTDVLSFPQIGVSNAQAGRASLFCHQHLGDILISIDQAERQATAQNLSLEKEIAFLILHSILHLVGYDHDTKKRREQMQGIESRIWRKLGRGVRM